MGPGRGGEAWLSGRPSSKKKKSHSSRSCSIAGYQADPPWSPDWASGCFAWPYEVAVFFQAEDGIREATVTGVQTCALPISKRGRSPRHGRGPAGVLAPQRRLEPRD